MYRQINAGVRVVALGESPRLIAPYYRPSHSDRKKENPTPFPFLEEPDRALGRDGLLAKGNTSKVSERFSAAITLIQSQ